MLPRAHSDFTALDAYLAPAPQLSSTTQTLPTIYGCKRHTPLVCASLSLYLTLRFPVLGSAAICYLPVQPFRRCLPGTEGRPSSSRRSCSAFAALAGAPAVGVRPSRSAFLMSPAFHAA